MSVDLQPEEAKLKFWSSIFRTVREPLRGCVLLGAGTAIEYRTVSFCISPFQISGPQTDWPSPSAAVAYYDDQELEDKIDGIIHLASVEGFMDGMENRMTSAVERFVTSNPVSGSHQLAIRLNSDRVNHEIAGDIVRALGRVQNLESHWTRIDIAERLLYSESPIARDAATLALETIGDPSASFAIRRAMDVETIPQLKADMQASLEELTRSADVVHS